jgi:signal transduction histidine kinase
MRAALRRHGTQGTGGWAFVVADEGPGIPHDNLTRIFDAFERGTGHGKPGVGLGLAIAAQASEVLGGQVGVQSVPGVGSTFRLSLLGTMPSGG